MKCWICGKDAILSSGIGDEAESPFICEECKTVASINKDSTPSNQIKPECPNHPGVEAEFKCDKCGALLCKECVSAQSDGNSICLECKKKIAKIRKSRKGPSIPEGTMCLIHPGVLAENICQICQAPMCKTCDFSFPNDIHVCPKCVNKPYSLSPAQKKSLVWSYIMAAIGTVGYFSNIYLFLNLSIIVSAQLHGIIFLISTLAPSIAGYSLGINARPRNRKKTTSIWGALIWNCILIVLFYVLIMIALLRKKIGY